MEKALNEVKAIMDELSNLRDINLDTLDELGKRMMQFIVTKAHLILKKCGHLFAEKRLTAAEADVNRANLTERLADLDRVKNEQNLSIKSYQNEMLQLEDEVNNIKLISEALPAGCFKQPRLEP